MKVERPVPLLDKIKSLLETDQIKIDAAEEALYIDGSGDNKNKWILKSKKL